VSALPRLSQIITVTVTARAGKLQSYRKALGQRRHNGQPRGKTRIEYVSHWQSSSSWQQPRSAPCTAKVALRRKDGAERRHGTGGTQKPPCRLDCPRREPGTAVAPDGAQAQEDTNAKLGNYGCGGSLVLDRAAAKFIVLRKPRKNGTLHKAKSLVTAGATKIRAQSKLLKRRGEN